MATQAKNNQVFKSTEVDARELELPQSPPVEMSPVGSAEDLTDLSFGDLVTGADPEASKKAYADELLFNEELVQVVVHTTNDKYAEHLVKLGVDGRNQFLIRGKPERIKRKYVEVLARAKPVGITTREATDNTGGRTTVIDKEVSLMYPFSVLHDPNPRGAAWLQQIMAEA